MTRSFSQSPRSNDFLAWVFLVVGVALVVVQVPELLRSGRVPIAWKSHSGVSYGPAWMAVAGPWAIVLAVGILWAGRRARIEVDDEGLTDHGLLRTKPRMRWSEVRSIEREVVPAEGREYGRYTVRSDDTSLSFSEQTRDWKDLLLIVLERVPSTATKVGISDKVLRGLQ